MGDEIRSLFEQVRDFWLEKRVRVRPGLLPAELDLWEEEHGVLLPYEVREYHSVVDGMEPGELDVEGFYFWPLSTTLCLGREWGRLPHNIDDPNQYYVFSDWLIGSHHYAFHVSPHRVSSATVIWFAEEDSSVMGCTLSDFFSRYLQSPESVVFP